MQTATAAPDLIPGLCYPNAREGITFLERAFGFEEHLVAQAQARGSHTSSCGLASDS
ncbi:MAG: hypothetical protein ACREM2_02315 [Vulcanimicrobiaceae bacterium]